MRVVRGLDIVIDERGRVDVVHHEVELAVIIEVGIRRAVREARTAHSPRVCLVGEGKVTRVAEDVVGLIIAGKTAQCVQSRTLRGVFTARSTRGVRGGHVVQIVDRLGIAIADEDVLEAIVVEVREQCTPAPIAM